MEILNFVVECRPRKAVLFIVAAVLWVFSGLLILVSPCESSQAGGRDISAVVYMLACLVCICIVAQWVGSSAGFRRDVWAPLEVYRNDRGHQELAKKYACFCYSCSPFVWIKRKVFGNSLRGRLLGIVHPSGAQMRKEKFQQQSGERMPFASEWDDVPVLCAKFWFWLIWIVLSAGEVLALMGSSLPLFPKIYLALLVVIGTLLNGSSYSLCCVYVWYLNELAKLPNLCELPHIPHKPSLTFEYRRLSKIAKSNTLLFLFVSLAFSLVILLCFLLLPAGQPIGIVQMGCVVMMLTVGYATFVALFAFSKISLHRVVDAWRFDFSRKVCDEYYRSESSALKSQELLSGKALATRKICTHTLLEVEGLSEIDRIDVLTVLIAAVTLFVNIATFVLALGAPA